MGRKTCLAIVMSTTVFCLVTTAYADVLHLSCRALTPWNGGTPARPGFSMTIDIDAARQTVTLQPDIDKCCQTYRNATEADGGKASVSFDVDKVAFGLRTRSRQADFYTFDIYSGTLTHDFIYPSEGGGADRHIMSTYQCIDLRAR